jgi:hypothetical protein
MPVFMPGVTFSQGYELAAFTGTFQELTGATAIDALEQDDFLTDEINIGFSFQYFENSYSSLRISSNGVVVFGLDPGSSPTLNENVLSTSSVLGIIAPLWDDLSGVGGAASYKVEGSSPDRIFTMEWRNWRWNYAATPNISFQLKLYESTNNIEFIYQQEAGNLNGSDASIGLIGNQTKHFYALSDASSSPVFSFNGNNQIATKPLSGQVYRFSPVAVSAPTIAATGMVVTTEAETISVSCAEGNGQYRAIFIKQTSSATDLFTPADGNYYAQSSVFGTSAVGSGWFCVYNGDANHVDVTNLKSGLYYKIFIVEYNGIGGSQRYLTSTHAENPSVIQTPLVRPSGQSSIAIPLRVSATEASFDLKEGNGYKRVVFIKEKSGMDDVQPVPVADGSTYSPSLVFRGGTQLGTSGWYCIYNGSSASTLTITGLEGSKTYVIQVADYNGMVGSETYYANENNVLEFETYHSVAVPAYDFQKSSSTFTALANATDLDEIEKDEAISAPIDIGFIFWFGGVPFTRLAASSNGFVSFNEHVLNAVETSDQSLNALSASMLRPLIAPLWDDLEGSSGKASYSVAGEAPARVFTIEYLNWKWNFAAAAPVISFQVKLHEGTNRIGFCYRREQSDLLDGSASTGLAFHNRGVNNFVSLDNLSPTASVSETTEFPALNIRPETDQVFIFTPIKFGQEIEFDELSTKVFGNESFKLTGHASSGFVVRYTSSDDSIAEIFNGDSVNIIRPGTAVITAFQDGDVNFNAALPVSRTLVIDKAQQLIQFDELETKTFGDDNFMLHAEASSGMSVSFFSSDETVAEINGNEVTIKSGGSVNITARQEGSENYYQAPEATRSFTILRAKQIIDFSQESKLVSDAPFVLNGIADSGLPIDYITEADEIILEGSLVTVLKPGMVKITAIQPGNQNYEPESISVDFCINPVRPSLQSAGVELYTAQQPEIDNVNVWFLDGVLIEGASSSFLQAESTGNYTTLVMIDGCSSEISEVQRVVITSSEHSVENEIQVYPNPASDVLFIITTAHNEVEVLLLDNLGKAVMRNATSSDLSLDVTDLAPGLYTLIIHSDSGVAKKSFIKR